MYLQGSEKKLNSKKVQATLLFLLVIMHRKSHMSTFCLFFLFLPYLQDHSLLRSRILLPKQSDVTTSTYSFFYLAITNSSRTILAPSPINFCTSSDPETLMNVHSVWCATARASSVLPVPGGPYSNTPWKKQLFRMKDYKVGFTNGV